MAGEMLKVLIAEDELMIADMAEETLVKHGYEVCGIARTVAEAVRLWIQRRTNSQSLFSLNERSCAPSLRSRYVLLSLHRCTL